MRLATDLKYNGVPVFSDVPNGDEIGVFAGIPPSLLGIQKFTATPAALGSRIVSPSGTGSAGTVASPGNLQSTLWAAQPGDVIFLRGGTYVTTALIQVQNSGTKEKPIIIESYPGEVAILDGSSNTPRTGQYITVNVGASWVIFRNIEVYGMPDNGIYNYGSHNIFEHNSIHGCALSGFSTFDSYTSPERSSYNIVRSNLCYDNSDAGLSGNGYNNGDNADGISISSGEYNIVEHNVCFLNSDDGIDIWKSARSTVRYNITYKNGLGTLGNGNGIKAGGDTTNKGNLVEHNLSYMNRSLGYTFNGSTWVTFNFNTSFANIDGGYDIDETSIMKGNVSISEARSILGAISENQTNNSWQRSSAFVPKGTDVSSTEFMFLKEITTPVYESISRWSGVGNSTTISTSGDTALSTVGTATASNVAATGNYLSLSGVEFLASASSSAVAGVYKSDAAKWFKGSTAVSGAGGFDFFCAFGIATGAGSSNRIFAGLTSSLSAPTDVNPSTLLNMIGIGADAADANLSIMYNDGAGAATKVSLGALFAKPTSDRTGCFMIRVFCYPMSGELYYTARNLVNGAVKNGLMYTDLPTASTLLAPRAWVSAGGVSSAVGLKFVDMSIITRM